MDTMPGERQHILELEHEIRSLTEAYFKAEVEIQRLRAENEKLRAIIGKTPKRDDTRHEFKPHPKYPSFCEECGYYATEPLQHKL